MKEHDDDDDDDDDGNDNDSRPHSLWLSLTDDGRMALIYYLIEATGLYWGRGITAGYC